MRIQDYRESIKDVLREMNLKKSRNYFGWNSLGSLLKEEAAACMHHFMSACAGREAFLENILTTDQMKRTLGDFADKAVQIAV